MAEQVHLSISDRTLILADGRFPAIRETGDIVPFPGDTIHRLTLVERPEVVALLNALLAPKNDRERLAVAVLMGDDAAVLALVDRVKEELQP